MTASPAPLFWLREFARLEVDWCRALCDPVELAGAAVFASAAWPGVVDANSVANAWLPVGTSWADFAAEVAAVFTSAATSCRRWIPNPSMPADQTDPIADALVADGWKKTTRPLLRWNGALVPPANVPGFTIVPARSAYATLDDFYARRGHPAAVAHLDDPQIESWVALSTGAVTAAATVQVSGKTAVLRDWYVDPAHRRIGLGRALLGRVVDLCRRAETTGLLAIAHEPASVVKAGFQAVSEWVEYLK